MLLQPQYHMFLLPQNCVLSWHTQTRFSMAVALFPYACTKTHSSAAILKKGQGFLLHIFPHVEHPIEMIRLPYTRGVENDWNAV